MSGPLLNPEITSRALALVEVERANQDAKWGLQDHPPAAWISILAEEFGEASKEANAIQFAPPLAYVSMRPLLKELTHTAAVAVAMIEFIIRHRPDTDTNFEGPR